MDSRAKELFDEAVANCRKLAVAERMAQLERRYYPAYDSRRVHVWSMEVGRAQALIDEHGELQGEVFDPEIVRAEAWDEAEARWGEKQRSRAAVQLLVDAAAEDHAERQQRSQPGTQEDH